MGINPGRLVQMYESLGASAYQDKLDTLLGIAVDENGHEVIKDQLIKPTAFSIKELGEAFCGTEVIRNLCHRPHGIRGGRARLFASEVHEGGLSGAMGPSQFAQINAWLGTVTGLVGAQILEKYNDYDFIGKQIVGFAENQKTDQQKRIRYSPPTNAPDDLQPGQEIPMGNLAAEWVRDHKMAKSGQGLAFTRETIHFDQTDSVMASAGDIGYQLGFTREEKILKPIFGIENTYSYIDTPSDTYRTSGSYVNMIDNELVGPTAELALDLAEQQLLKQTHPATGRPIGAGGQKFLITTPFKGLTASRVVRATQYVVGPDSGAERMVVAPTIVGVKPFVSQLAVNLMVNTKTGPAGSPTEHWTPLTETQAKNRWVWGATQKAMIYREAWPLTQYTINVTEDVSLAQRDLIMAIFATELGSVTVVEPRYAVLNYHG